MEENNKSRKFMLFGLIVLVITIAVSSTYAYYVWTTTDNEVTKIVAGVGSATVTFDGGSDINANLRPVSDKSKGIVKEIKVKADTTGLTFNMYLDITSIATELKDVSFRYEFYKGTTKVKEGNFSDTYLNSNTADCSTNSTKHITLLTGESIGTTNSAYTLYIWIDGANYVNPNTMMGKEFNFKLHADGEGAVVKNPLTAAQYITQLYTDASKTTITNNGSKNGSKYNMAPSVSLMNDRLGGTTVDLDGGNIRYYGKDVNTTIYAWQSEYADSFATSNIGRKFTSREDCISSMDSWYDCSTNYNGLGFGSEEDCFNGINGMMEGLFGNGVDMNEVKYKFCLNDIYPVNNYVYFNCSDYSNQSSSTCETWRIIGVFDGKVKVIRNESIGNYAWDNKDASTGGKNDWTTARLMKLLNPSDYYTIDSNDNGLGQSLYYNSESGKCYSDVNNATVDCDFTSTGIKNNITRNLISEETWNLGGVDDQDGDLDLENTYDYERKITTYSESFITWIGKIGLLYLSDFGYASDFNKCATYISGYGFSHSATYDFCTLDSWNWLSNNDYKRLLTPGGKGSWIVDSDGSVDTSSIMATEYSIQPVLYLKFDLKFKSGDGSSTNPYQLAV